jgi:ankyrin repeat protein
MASKDANSEQLCAAARAGDCDAVSRLLAEGISPDPVWDADEAATMHDRMRRKMREQMPDIMRDAGIDEDLMSEMMDSSEDPFDAPPTAPYSHEIPLFCAAESGNEQCLELLIAAGANLAQRDESQCTALFYATSPECVKRLIASGVDVHAMDRMGSDALQENIEHLESSEKYEKVAAVCRALLDEGALLVRQLRLGSGRLYYAAFGEDFHAVRFLLDAGHPIRADERTTALHAICWHWDYGDERDNNIRAIVRALLAAGLTVHDRDEHGNTPLHEALSGDGSNLVAAEELLAAGADINAVNNDGVTPLLLHYETLFDYDRVVPFMLKHGANPLVADRRGQTVIDAARRMIEGGQPMWRTEEFVSDDNIPCGWKGPAEPGDKEHAMLARLEEAARRFGHV